MIRCALCVRYIRFDDFPERFFFWRSWAYEYNTQVEDRENHSVRGVQTYVCAPCLSYAHRNPVVTQGIIESLVARADKDADS